MALLDDLTQHIHNNSIATLATNLFQGYMPESPVTAIAIFETGGVEPSMYLPITDPTFQVLIRAADYTTGKNLLTSIRALFHQKYNVRLVPSGIYFYSIDVNGEGGHIGRDEVGRDMFSINFICKIRQ